MIYLRITCHDVLSVFSTTSFVALDFIWSYENFPSCLPYCVRKTSLSSMHSYHSTSDITTRIHKGARRLQEARRATLFTFEIVISVVFVVIVLFKKLNDLVIREHTGPLNWLFTHITLHPSPGGSVAEPKRLHSVEGGSFWEPPHHHYHVHRLCHSLPLLLVLTASVTSTRKRKPRRCSGFS